MKDLTNHLRIASLHHDRSKWIYRTARCPRPNSGSYARLHHTLLHFVTLFNTFRSCQPHCSSHTTSLVDLGHTFPHDRSDISIYTSIQWRLDSLDYSVIVKKRPQPIKYMMGELL